MEKVKCRGSMRREEAHLSVHVAKEHWCEMGTRTHKYREEEKAKKRDQGANAVVEKRKNRDKRCREEKKGDCITHRKELPYKFGLSLILDNCGHYNLMVFRNTCLEPVAILKSEI